MAKRKAPSAPPPPPACGHKEAEERLFRDIIALIKDVARLRSLSAVEVAGVLTAVTHDVLTGVWMLEWEQRRKAQERKEA